MIVRSVIFLIFLIWLAVSSKSNTKQYIASEIASAQMVVQNAINEYTDKKLATNKTESNEYTDSQLDTDTEGKVVDRQFGIYFPSVFFNRKFNDNLNMNLSYSKRITRPKFDDLAPFVIFFDPNTFFSGNPAVQPSIANAIKLGFNYRSIDFCRF